MSLNQSLRKNSRVLWAISLIQDQNPDAQTKSEFSEMANDVINTETIDCVVICLADNLQRFRLMVQHGITEQEAMSECQKMASTWHQDNVAELEKLRETKKLSLLTWDEFLAWSDYEDTIIKLENWYKENRDFRNSVDGRVRQARQNIGIDAKIYSPVQQTELLKKYLLEECAFQKFAASKGFDYELYKTPTCKAMRQVKNNPDFVPHGFMCEVYFTQFNSSVKNNNIIHTQKESFSPLFNKKVTKQDCAIDSSISIKFSEFIEKTIKMLPPHQQSKAVESLIKFTTQEILPLYYSSHTNTMKI